MALWSFKTAARHTRSSSTHQWYWQLDTHHSLLLTSLRLFVTLEACVADAQESGFRGALHVPENLAYPAVLTWEEGAPLGSRARIGNSSAQQAV